MPSLKYTEQEVNQLLYNDARARGFDPSSTLVEYHTKVVEGGIPSDGWVRFDYAEVG